MLFKKLKEIEEQYEMGEAPDPDELSGEYYVTAPCFPWFSLEPLKHRKDVGLEGEGENVMAGGMRFGNFQLVKEDDSLLIDYDLDENAAHMRRVVDRIRRTPDGRLIGKLHYRLFGEEVFLLYFEMVPKED